MAGGSASFHEAEEKLTPLTRDMHRAIVSLMEELEAIDWYQQRVDAAQDDELREILRHNRDEEQEHAAMVLEWIRRHDASFDSKLKEYLFTDGPIVGREAQVTGKNGAATPSRPGTAAPAVALGSLRNGR